MLDISGGRRSHLRSQRLSSETDPESGRTGLSGTEMLANRRGRSDPGPTLSVTMTPHDPLPAQGSLMAKKVLCVDDHVPTRALIKTILEAEKSETFEVIEAGTGTECLKAADTKGPFDLVLLDVNLPDMDGYSVCRALRHVDKKVPIVFVTAKGDLKDYTAGREAGGDSYLVKPIARAALRSIVNLFTTIERAKREAGGA